MEPTLAQIVMFGGNFAPRGWALCDGQLLPISQNQALFSLLGTMYGGDGRITFALPDLRGRGPIGPGQGPGLPNHYVGGRAGWQTNTLSTSQLPSHTHTGQLSGTTAAADASDPSGRVPAQTDVRAYSSSGPPTNMNGPVLGSTGGNQSVNNMQPWLAVNYIIAIQGIFPVRS